MPFEKGNTLGGRTPGAVAKNTTEIRKHFQSLVSENLEQLNADLKELEPLQRLRIIIELAKFVVPTLKAVEQNVNIGEIQGEPFDITKLYDCDDVE